jgi:rod shape-determining protein MreC
MRKTTNKKPIVFFIAFIVITVSLIIASAKNRANVAFLDNVVNVTVTPAARFFTGIGNGAAGFFGNFQSKKQLLTTVDELTYKNNVLEQKYAALSALEGENERLRNLLALKEKYPEFTTVGASVIAKDGGNCCRFITIDKGNESGIDVNHAVIADNGLVGIVFEAGAGWSKIQTILDPSTSAGCRVTRTGEISLAEGDISLVNGGLLKMTYISKQQPILDGDIIETSGLGEIYPRGIPIGRVKEIKISEINSSQYATIMPIVNFSDIYEVLIITGSYTP